MENLTVGQLIDFADNIPLHSKVRGALCRCMKKCEGAATPHYEVKLPKTAFLRILNINEEGKTIEAELCGQALGVNNVEGMVTDWQADKMQAFCNHEGYRWHIVVKEKGSFMDNEALAMQEIRAAVMFVVSQHGFVLDKCDFHKDRQEYVMSEIILRNGPSTQVDFPAMKKGIKDRAFFTGGYKACFLEDTIKVQWQRQEKNKK